MAGGKACPNCHEVAHVEHLDTGAVCTACGFVISESQMVNTVEFTEASGGTSAVVGQFVSATSSKRYGSGGAFNGQMRDSSDVAFENGKKHIKQIASHLALPETMIDQAERLYIIAVSDRFTQGRKASIVAACCLYIIARRDSSSHPYFLVDFAEAANCNVISLGGCYLKVIRALPQQARVNVIDPSFYLYRYAQKLELGGDAQRISNTASSIVGRMSRDWMVTGRRPAGICGASLLIACRIHGYERSVEDIMEVVKVTDVTLRNRLAEFENTSSSKLPVEALISRANPLEEDDDFDIADPPSYTRGLIEEELTRSANLLYNAFLSDMSQPADGSMKTGELSDAITQTSYTIRSVLPQYREILSVVPLNNLPDSVIQSVTQRSANIEAILSKSKILPEELVLGEDKEPNWSPNGKTIEDIRDRIMSLVYPLTDAEASVWKSLLLSNSHWGRARSRLEKYMRSRQNCIIRTINSVAEDLVNALDEIEVATVLNSVSQAVSGIPLQESNAKKAKSKHMKRTKKVGELSTTQDSTSDVASTSSRGHNGGSVTASSAARARASLNWNDDAASVSYSTLGDGVDSAPTVNYLELLELKQIPDGAKLEFYQKALSDSQLNVKSHQKRFMNSSVNGSNLADSSSFLGESDSVAGKSISVQSDNRSVRSSSSYALGGPSVYEDIAQEIFEELQVDLNSPRKISQDVLERRKHMSTELLGRSMEAVQAELRKKSSASASQAGDPSVPPNSLEASHISRRGKTISQDVPTIFSQDSLLGASLSAPLDCGEGLLLLAPAPLLSAVVSDVNDPVESISQSSSFHNTSILSSTTSLRVPGLVAPPAATQAPQNREETRRAANADFLFQKDTDAVPEQDPLRSRPANPNHMYANTQFVDEHSRQARRHRIEVVDSDDEFAEDYFEDEDADYLRDADLLGARESATGAAATAVVEDTIESADNVAPSLTFSKEEISDSLDNINEYLLPNADASHRQKIWLHSHSEFINAKKTKSSTKEEKKRVRPHKPQNFAEQQLLDREHEMHRQEDLGDDEVLVLGGNQKPRKLGKHSKNFGSQGIDRLHHDE